ncbi:hypothetical protein Tco_0273883 [Tanacetum coccineum]
MSSAGKFVHDSNKAPDSPPHPHTVSSNQRHCFHCKDVLGNGEFCQRCTCMRCGSGLSKGLCLICSSRYGNNPYPNSLNDSPNISENVSQSPPLIDHHYCYGCGDSLGDIFCQRCTCESCGNGAHYGYNCPPQVPIISNPEPCNNQTIDELPQTLPSFDPTCYSGDGKKQHQPEDIQELLRKLLNDVQIISEELADYINTPNWNRPAFYNNDDDDEEYTIAITPVLPTVEPDNSLSIGDDHLSTIPEKEEISVKNLVPILSEFEGISDNMCDVPFCNNPPTLEAKDHSEIVIDSNDDYSSSDDDSPYSEDIDYVDALPPDSELVSLEVEEIVIPEVGGIDTDILLTIKDDVLCEKLLNGNLLIAKIEELQDNPTPSSNFVTKSSSTSLNFFLEETNTFDNSLPQSKTFCFNLEEISSGNPTSYSDLFLPDYEAFFCDSQPDLGDFIIDVVEDIFDNTTR